MKSLVLFILCVAALILAVQVERRLTRARTENEIAQWNAITQVLAGLNLNTSNDVRLTRCVQLVVDHVDLIQSNAILLRIEHFTNIVVPVPAAPRLRSIHPDL